MPNCNSKPKQQLQLQSNCLKVCASAYKAESSSSNKPLKQRGHQQLRGRTNVVECLLQSPSQDASKLAHNCQKRVCRPKLSQQGTRPLVTTSRKAAKRLYGSESAVAETSGKACLGRSLKRPLQIRVCCRSASSSTSQRCHKLVLSRRRRQTAQEKPDKSWIAAQCMVSGTVFATDVASQPLRSRLHADYATKTTTSWRNGSTAAAHPHRIIFFFLGGRAIHYMCSCETV